MIFRPPFETRRIHAGARPDPATGAWATPLYQSTSFAFTDAHHAADAFAPRDLETHAYTRLSNPTLSLPNIASVGTISSRPPVCTASNRTSSRSARDAGGSLSSTSS
ncbi:PLP-dependent transferase [Amycolatopsis japonica]|uniref:PLP-dependent transferase n=1 Tax=Amycolatopsis japonica TaxID=208439 RepID=UPI00366A7B30